MIVDISEEVGEICHINSVHTNYGTGWNFVGKFYNQFGAFAVVENRNVAGDAIILTVIVKHICMESLNQFLLIFRENDGRTAGSISPLQKASVKGPEWVYASCGIR